MQVSGFGALRPLRGLQGPLGIAGFGVRGLGERFVGVRISAFGLRVSRV